MLLPVRAQSIHVVAAFRQPGSGVVALAFTGASVGGFRWDARCTEAKDQWDRRQIEQDELVQNEKRKRRREAKEAKEEVQQFEKSHQATLPRGFFCATATSAGFCMREKADCEQTRDVSLTTLPDLTACSLVETAWCTGDLCFPNAETCVTRVGREPGRPSCLEAQ